MKRPLTNEGIVSAPDVRTTDHGVEQWSLVAPYGLGDCEDYALTKRFLLLWAGVPAGSMRLAVVRRMRDRLAQRHMILLVNIGGAEFALDSLTNVIWPADAVQYEWVETENPGDPWMWSAP